MYNGKMLRKNSKILTPKQKKIFDFICKYAEEKDCSPTVLELAAFMRVSSLRTVTQYLESLEKKNLISRLRHQSRGIRIVQQKNFSATVVLPVLSMAGCDNMDVFADQSYDEYITIDREFLGGRKKENVFVFKAFGDSMVQAGIATGDLVLTEKTTDISEKDKVVAVVDGMAVIKQIFFTPNAVILRPMSSNPKYRPIVMKKGFEVFGRVIDVIKNSNENRELTYEIV